MSGEIYCDVCKNKEMFCPQCKTKAIHLNVKALHGQIPSVTKIQGEKLNTDLPVPVEIPYSYELHNYICFNCKIVFGIHDLGGEREKNTIKAGTMEAKILDNKFGAVTGAIGIT